MMRTAETRSRSVAALSLAALLVACGGRDAEPAAEVGNSPGAAALGVYDEIGGDFELTDHRGRRFRLAETHGRVRLLFFGYAMCPDVCPLTMSKVVRVRQVLGADSDRLMTLFVSVDPGRDTPEKLREYLDYFDLGDAAALVGSREEIDAVVDLFKATYRIAETGPGTDYVIDHTPHLFLLDRRGTVRALFRPAVEPGEIAGAIRVLLSEPG